MCVQTRPGTKFLLNRRNISSYYHLSQNQVKLVEEPHTHLKHFVFECRGGRKKANSGLQVASTWEQSKYSTW